MHINYQYKISNIHGALLQRTVKNCIFDKRRFLIPVEAGSMPVKNGAPLPKKSPPHKKKNPSLLKQQTFGQPSVNLRLVTTISPPLTRRYVIRAPFP